MKRASSGVFPKNTRFGKQLIIRLKARFKFLNKTKRSLFNETHAKPYDATWDPAPVPNGLRRSGSGATGPTRPRHTWS